MPSERVVRVYQEDWWPFQNLPNALRAFTEKTGIATELSWDKVGVGSIFISHNLHHIYPIADRIVAMARGAKIADIRKTDTSIEGLTELIV